MSEDPTLRALIADVVGLMRNDVDFAVVVIHDEASAREAIEQAQRWLASPET